LTAMILLRLLCTMTGLSLALGECVQGLIHNHAGMFTECFWLTIAALWLAVEDHRALLERFS